MSAVFSSKRETTPVRMESGAIKVFVSPVERL